MDNELLIILELTLFTVFASDLTENVFLRLYKRYLIICICKI